MQDLFESDDVKIPEDFQKMEDLRQILVYASLRDEDTISLQRWSCAILKVMHVISHINNDLYAVYQEGAKGVQLAELGMTSWKERRWVDVPGLG